MSARPIAARRPAIPPPMTSVFGVVSTTIGSSGVVSRVRAIPARTRPRALSVAASSSSRWTHEHCSRTLTWVYSYGLTPARAATPRNVYVWSFGEQEATTRPSRPYFSMSSAISCWPASEQANMGDRATTTASSPSASEATRSTST